jgi:hypothetical protein
MLDARFIREVTYPRKVYQRSNIPTMVPKKNGIW